MCGGYLETSEGRFTSPNYPNLYPHARQCEWRIEAHPDRRVTLTIDDLDLEAHARCAYDYVAVSDAHTFTPLPLLLLLYTMYKHKSCI